MGMVCLEFASLSRKTLIFEHRSGAYVKVCEQRSAEHQGFTAKIVELSTDLNNLLIIFGYIYK